MKKLLVLLLSIAGILPTSMAASCDADFVFEVSGSIVSFGAVTTPGPGDVLAYTWDFGDGSFGDAENPEHEYDFAGTYEVCLTVIFWDSCIADFCDEVTVTEGGFGCAASFEWVSDGLDADFTAITTPGPGDVTNYFWTFGDGSTDEGDDDPAHEYSDYGTYEVCLTVYFDGGCVAEYCDEISIGDSTGGGGDCTAFLDATAIEGLTVDFFGALESDFDLVYYSFTFGDGGSFEETSSSAGSDPSYTYDVAGTYEVCLFIETGTGCTDEVCISVTVGDSIGDCEANFIWEASGLDVDFEAFTTPGPGDVLDYVWDYGDGTVEEGDETMNHDYAEPGSYLVCLTVYFYGGCIAEICDEITVTEDGGDAECEAYFNVVSLEPDGTGWNLVLNNESVVTGGDIGTILWFFGDGSTATTYDAEHYYEMPGTYEVCVVITSADGSCVDEYCDDILIGGGGGECAADFEFETDGLSVSFINNSEGLGLAFTWTFGDGDYSYLENPDHTYPIAGEYEVCLTVFGADSCVDTQCEVIDLDGVSDDCNAYFNVDDITESGDGWIVYFNNESEGDFVGQVWSFGDGDGSITSDPDHYYAESGWYLVCLVIGDSTLDCFDTHCQEIWVGSIDDCTDTGIIDTSFGCPEIYEPVCGCDGITYDNECYAYYYGGVLFWTDGPCITDGVEEEILLGMTIAPNPAADVTQISLQTSQQGQLTIRIMDVTGKVWKETFVHAVAEERISFDTSQLPSGMYLVHITDGAHSATQKLLINR